MKLYRYISFEEFVDIVQNKKLSFVYPPEAWEDTYEGFLFRAIQTTQGKERILELLPSGAKKSFVKGSLTEKTLSRVRYQCWSEAKDSIAMWSIYSNQKKALMICTSSETLEKLSYNDHYVGISNITYVENPSIKAEIDEIFKKFKVFIPNIFNTKRDGFAHEKEVRAHIGMNEEIDPQTPLRVPIPSAQTFIESVLVHPSADIRYVNLVEEYCRANGITFLGQSELYKFKC